MTLAVEKNAQEFAAHVGLPRGCSSPAPNEKAPCSLNIGVSGRQTTTERQKYQIWPSLKKSVMASGRRTPDLSDLKKKPLKEGGTLYRRRKISVPELGPLTTVQERNIDSPTIPGKFPAHERSNSAPGASWGRTTYEYSALDPVGEPVSSAKESFRKVVGSSPTEDDGHKSIKRASSLLLPDALAEHPSVASVVDVEISKATLPIKRSESNWPEKERPEVPPKSPRLGLRNATTQPMANYSSVSSDSPAPQLAVPMSSTTADNFSEQNFIFPLHTKSAQAKPGSFDLSLLATPWISPSPLKGRGTSNHSRNRSVDVCQPYQRAITPPLTLHRMGSMSLDNKRELHQDSVAEKIPPRDKSPVEGPLGSEPNKQPLGHSFLILPAGIPAHTASKLLSRDEIERLKIQAWEQAKRFEVLKHSEVRSLSRELRALDKRCDYLRETYKSLRSGRRSLHTRMISYLKSPRVSKFSREGILKQEEALSELDRSIDEWVCKLEHAENRRIRIRQKLLEHMAGTMTLWTPHYDDKILADDQTPPRSPSRAGTPPKVNRREVESIKIYAGAELHTLFANIEKEMERMSNPTPSTPPATALAF
ncbi:hypothetical protein AJ78_02034 [Emergomyces pasteurianus Ep9510]|uniref:Up-regulated during septation protein 1 domain-containing protein n=1 Tax=Emergomyces pasteurianus Ep9510 TaxID=1447872 RepID=A0A1J9PNB9_9EURO|nr:hypothetical protein AJ78_02034 [Emergomyces pasteurianus Ep9510]